ncbi:MAG: hypothetical protein ACREIR_25895 [Geminicoccaceae bacterium]
MSEARNERSGRAPVPPRSVPPPEVVGAAWRRLPWRARLILLLHRLWPQLTRLPLLRRWLARAVIRFITEVGLAKARRRAGDLPDEVFEETRGERLIRHITIVVGVTVILARHLGRLVLSIGAFAFLIPFLLWPPLWPEIRIAIDAARRDLEDDRDPKP